MASTVGNLWVRINADNKGLMTGLAASSAAVKSFSAMATAGFIALGVAATAASVAMAAEFQASMTRIVALVGVSRKQVDAWSEEILDLSRVIPEAPKAFADAMFYITSAGFRGAEAMNILKISGMAAASGLGEMKTIADVVTSAMNAYADTGITAAQATDVLIAAVTAGKFAPEDLAQNLGQVLPVADLVGVSLAEVAASVAMVSRQGLSVPRATTGLRFLLGSMIRPSQQAVKALAEIRMSVQDLQDSLAQRGLLATLEMLGEKFDVSTAAGRKMFATILGGSRGSYVGLAMIGDKLTENHEILDRVTNSAGDTTRAFGEMSKTAAFQFSLVISNLKALAIELGNAFLPTVTGALETVSATLKAMVSPLRMLLAVIGPLTPLVVALFEAFLAYKVLGWLPKLFADIAIQAARLGANIGLVNIAKISTALAPLAGIAAGPLAVVGAIGGIAAIADAYDKAHTSFMEVEQDVTGLQMGYNELGQMTARLADGTVVYKGTVDEVTAAVRQQYLDQQKLARQAASVADAMVQEAHANKLAAMEVAAHSAQIRGLMTEGEQALGSLGVDYGTFRAEAVAALRAQEDDTESWANFVKTTMGNARQALAQYTSQMVTNLNLVAASFAELASQPDVTAQAIAQGTTQSLREMRQFGKDIKTILADGGKGAKLLAEQLVNMGAAGAIAARRLVNSNKGVRETIEGNLAAAQNLAEDLATRLSRKMVAALSDIRDILKAIARQWNIRVELRGDARADVQMLKNDLELVTERQWRATVLVETIGGSTGFELIAKLTDALMDVTAPDRWHVDIKVTTKDMAELRRNFEHEFSHLKDAVADITSAIRSAVSEDLLRKVDLDLAKDLEDLLTRRERFFTKAIAQAERHLDKLKQKSKEFHDAIKGAFDDFGDLIGGFGELLSQYADDQAQYLEDLAAGTAGAAPTAPSATSFLQQQIADAQTLARLLQSLSRMGLAPELLAQLAGQGAAGIPIAQALLAGGKDLIAQFNEAQAAISSFANNTADALTNAQFGAALDEAAAEVKELADQMAKALERIKGKIEEFIAAVRADALANGVDDVIKALRRLANSLGLEVPEVSPTTASVPGASRVRGGGGEPTVVVNINGDVTGEDVATKVEEALIRRLSRTGAIFNGALRG